MFDGATTLLTETYRPEEQARVQAFNEFMVFGTTAVTSLASGVVFSSQGWGWVNLGTVVPVVLATAAALWLLRRRGPAAAAWAGRRGGHMGPARALREGKGGGEEKRG